VFEHFAAAGAPGAVMITDPHQTGEFVDHDIHNQAYVTYERTFGKLDLLAGLRGDALHIVLDPDVPNGLPSQEYDRLYPSLHLGYALADGNTLTASYSRRVDRPGYGQLDPIPYAQNPGFSSEGNPALQPQDTDSFELGLGSHKDASSLTATLYYRRTTDAFSNFYSIQSGGGLLQQTVNAGSLQNGGLEVVLANKLTPSLTYNLSADAYWTELSATNLGLAQSREAITGFGRANLNWQLTPKDFLQLNVFVNGETLLPQGYVQPFISGNIGYRRVVNSKVSWSFVVQDPFNTARTTEVLNSVAGRDRQTVTNHSRTALLSLVWNFSGKAPATDFDFKAGGYGSTAPP
jgi:outer membrane receptor protein involved in Fe transport